MYCSNCGYSNAPGALLCAQCGVALTGAAPDPSQAGGYPPPGAQPPASGEYPPPGSGEYPPAGAPGGYGPQGYPPSAPVGPPGYPPAPPYGAPPGYGYGPPPGGGGPRSQKGLLIGVLAVLVVAAMVAGAVLVLGSGGDDDDLVVLEPIDHVQEDDFAGNRDLEDVGADIAIAMGDTPAAQPEVDATLAGGVLPGDEPGLYGGSQDDEVCDIEGLISFLQDEANADKAEAWAETLNISGGVGGIPDYIEGLTSVRLRFDTRVTNHGFRDGEANPFQSVLQAGTAVLVDAAGVPRVKCNCGNPLTEPTPLGDVSVDDADNLDDLAQNPDAAWPEFTIVNVVVVQLGDEVDQFVMMELVDGSLFTRPVGSNGDDDGLLEDLGDICASDSKLADSPTCQEQEEEEEPELGTGDVQVTLRWDSEADLDLAIIEPDGTQIDFMNRGPTATGGQLDVDGNPNCATSVSIENIFWPENQAPTGGYSVAVTGYNVSCGAGDYTLTIRVAGQQDQVLTGVVGEDEVDYYDFEA